MEKQAELLGKSVTKKKQQRILLSAGNVLAVIFCAGLFLWFCVNQYQHQSVQIKNHLHAVLDNVTNITNRHLQNLFRQVDYIEREHNTKGYSKYDYVHYLPHIMYDKQGKEIKRSRNLESLISRRKVLGLSNVPKSNNWVLLASIKNNFSTLRLLPACKKLSSKQHVVCFFQDASLITQVLKRQYAYPDTRIQLINANGHSIFDTHDPNLLTKSAEQYAAISQELMAKSKQDNGYFTLGLKNLPSGDFGYINYNPILDLFTLVSVSNQHLFKYLTETLLLPLLLFAVFFLFVFWSSYRRRKSQQAYELISGEIDKLKIQNQDTVSLVTEHMPGIIYRVLVPDEMAFVSQNSFEFLGVRSGDIYKSGQVIADFVHPEDRKKYVENTQKNAKNFTKFESTYRIVTANNDVKWVIDRGRFFRNKQQQVMMEGMLFDISEHMASQKKIEYLATYDPLTNLKNRFMFNEEMLSCINANPDKPWVLMFVDLDRFKQINDSLGHQVGDKLLKIAADRLKSVLGPDTLIARMGADEFVALVANPNGRESADSLAQKIRQRICEIYRIDYYKLNTTCSVGISLFPEDTTDANELIKNADTSMLFAKSDGGNCHSFYTKEMKEQLNLRLTMENELKIALAEEQFEVFYQPKVCSKTFKIQGAEALIRWRHPQRGLVPPFEFIPIAEDTGLIIDIGQWILEESCRQFKAWNDQLDEPLSVAINLSVKQLNEDLLDKVVATINKTGISVSSLELEITETLLMNKVDENVRLLESLDDFGINISLDDFGTGYSSLSYLRKLPITNLKIDRSFTMNVVDDQDTRAIVETIVAMAKILKLKTVVEGIEDEEQMKILDKLNCDMYQGFYFSKPIPAKVFYNTYVQPIANNQPKVNAS